MNIWLIGDNRFASTFAAFARQSGHTVFAARAEDVIDGLMHAPACDAIIEAEVVSIAQKQRVLSALPADKPIHTLAINASITLAASWARIPALVTGCAWVLPMTTGASVVEIARGLQTSDDAFAAAQQFWRALGCTPQVVADGPALVRMRVLACLINEAICALADGVASATDIDRAMQLGTSYPRGPLAWGSALGLDVVLAAMQALFDEYGEDRYRPSPLLKRMVLAGRVF